MTFVLVSRWVLQTYNCMLIHKLKDKRSCALKNIINKKRK